MFCGRVNTIELIAILTLIICSARALKFKDNGYQNLVVSISPDVEEGSDGQLIIDNIKVHILIADF